jgi:pimeloyl-ACP methyl ester carboxylesterase
MEEPMSDPTFLLVHGSWHGPWCFEKLQAELEARGARSLAVALPSCGATAAGLGTLPDDAAAITGAAAAVDGPVVVVAHSYGGAAVSEATFGDNLRRLVFLTAFMPDTGRSYVSYLPPGDLPPFVQVNADGTFQITSGCERQFFYGDCPEDVAAWAASRVGLQSQAVMAHEITDASWRHHPSTYVMATEDLALPPFLQELFTPQADEVLSMPTSHSPFLSRPAELAELLVGLGGRAGSG